MGQSRNEDILESIIAGEEYSDVPKSREEYLLLQLKDAIEQGSGTTNYNLLTNKPKINSVELSGDKSLSDIGAQDTLTTTQLAAADSGITSTKVTQYDDIYAVMNHNALNHNGMFRGKNLTDIYTVDEMYERIHNGTFEDLYLGDYFIKRMTTDLYTRFTSAEFESGTTYYEMGGTLLNRTWTKTEDTTPQSDKVYYTKQTITENADLMFAAFDYYYNVGDTALTKHHAALIPRNYGFTTTSKMNTINTTTGGYINSYMHQTVLPCYAGSLRTALNNHLLSNRVILSNAISASTPSMAGAGVTGAASGWEWTTVELQLMNEVQVYGTTVWSSSAYDVGVDNRQLPVFKHINPVYLGRGNFWLRSVVSSTNFAYCNGNGYAYNNGASAAIYVRPLILFG